jgi:hypothetical protein
MQSISSSLPALINERIVKAFDYLRINGGGKCPPGILCGRVAQRLVTELRMLLKFYTTWPVFSFHLNFFHPITTNVWTHV